MWYGTCTGGMGGLHAHLTVHPSAPIPLYSSSKCRVKVPVPPAIITIRPLTRLPMEELQRMRELQPMRAPGLTNPLGGRCLETPATAFTQQKITTLINSYHLLHINSYHHVSFARPQKNSARRCCVTNSTSVVTGCNKPTQHRWGGSLRGCLNLRIDLHLLLELFIHHSSSFSRNVQHCCLRLHTVVAIFHLSQ